MTKGSIKYCYLKEIKKVTTRVFNAKNEKITINDLNKNDLVIFKIEYDENSNPYVLLKGKYSNLDFKKDKYSYFVYLWSLGALYYCFMGSHLISVKKQNYLIEKSDKTIEKIIKLLPFKNEEEKDDYLDTMICFKFWIDWEELNYKIAKRLKK